MEFGRRRVTPAKLLVVAHDLCATGAAMLASFYIRFEEAGLQARLGALCLLLPFFVMYAGGIYALFGLYRSKWRFASLPDLFNIFRASTTLAISLLVLDYILVAPNVLGTFFFGKITILLYWLLQMFFLGGSRLAYRYYRYMRTIRETRAPHSAPAFVLGSAADAEILLRAVEAGAIRKLRPLAILSPARADHGLSIRGVPVAGGFEDLDRLLTEFEARGEPVARIVLAPSAFDPAAKPEAILMQARRLGLTASRLLSLEEAQPRLAPVNVEDLLLRPSVSIDYRRLEDFFKGRAIAVTGGGGSIGAEICNRVATFGASRLLILENSEPALHGVLETLAAKSVAARVTGRLGDIRDRERLFRLLGEFRPDVVFHAAALKHVPLLERDWVEGIKTNVFGAVNVADAAAAAGAAGMVMISTDKAIEPVSMLGATKRLAEMYCQALDGELAQRGASGMRLIAVRFGNVLASNGSVVPKFKAQIEAGGPVTVTHPEMVRYFMTIREACDLVMTASSDALGAGRKDRPVYVLNMGQPVRIVELAERMIRLSGLEPGRDIDIVFTGIRPGERLHEVLFGREEESAEIGIPGVVAARPLSVPMSTMRVWLAMLETALAQEDKSAIYRVLREAVPDFRGEAA
ncbi:MAG TPA: nucleoside-diphosphate sugar epimerase/dehydratase [Pseudorhodoplanes sp.]|nr:nucleoside-diphosphate sugar epimerase/dehydratase [Pseudorhodoplanes sp.]